MSSILLIYPESGGMFARMPYPVLSLTGYLRERGVSADIINLHVQKKEEIDFKKYDYYGFSLQFTGPQIRSALDVARFLRKNGVNTPFIWGGTHVTITPEESVQNEFVDYVIRGEGEETLYQLIIALDKGKDPENVAGLTFKKQGKIINTSDRDFIDMDSLPLMPYYLLKNLQDYSEIKRKPSFVSIGTSRGCPYNCGFCYSRSVHRGKWRGMSPDRVILEIKNILKYFQPDIIMTNDDYFFASIPRAKEIAQKIIDEKLNIKWAGSMRFNCPASTDDQFWYLLKKSGFVNPNFGGESGSTKILNLIDKKISVEQMEDVISCLSKYDFTVYANYMLGLPGEKYSDVMKTFKLIKRLSAKNKNFFAGLSLYTPYPETPLYSLALKYGLKAPKRLEDWADYQYNSASNLPWLKGKVKSVSRTATLFTHFSFNQQPSLKYILPPNFVLLVVFFVLSISARIRWILNFFKFPIEWRIYEYALRKLRISER